MLKYIKLFDAFISNRISKKLGEDADEYSLNSDLIKTNKKEPLTYLGRFIKLDDKFFLKIKKDSKTEYLELIPTEKFHYESLELYYRMMSKFNLSFPDRNRFFETVVGYQIISTYRKKGIHKHIYVEDIKKVDMIEEKKWIYIANKTAILTHYKEQSHKFADIDTAYDFINQYKLSDCIVEPIEIDGENWAIIEVVKDFSSFNVEDDWW